MYNNLFALFETAISNNLKFPKLRFQTAKDVLIVKLNGAKSKYQGSICLTNDAGYGSPASRYYGRIEKNGGLVAGRDLTPEVESLLQRIAQDPIGTAAELGKLHGACVFCGKALTDQTSAAYGYGKVCSQKFGLPYTTNGKARKTIPTLDEQVQAFRQRTGGEVDLIAAVRAHAKQNYSIDGWDYVTESLDNLELADIIGDAKTPAAAIKNVGDRCKVWHQLREDSRQSEVEAEQQRKNFVEALIEDAEFERQEREQDRVPFDSQICIDREDA